LKLLDNASLDPATQWIGTTHITTSIIQGALILRDPKDPSKVKRYHHPFHCTEDLLSQALGQLQNERHIETDSDNFGTRYRITSPGKAFLIKEWGEIVLQEATIATRRFNRHT